MTARTPLDALSGLTESGSWTAKQTKRSTLALTQSV